MIYTLGHGTLEAGRFAELLKAHDVGTLVDVRSFPGGRHSPQYGRETMERWMPEAGVAYRWIQDLGGRRRTKGPSRHMALEHASFRSYADYMETDGFASGIGELLGVEGVVAYSCCESVYWRCHRRMISDYLSMVLGIEVRHIMHDGKIREHRPTRGVRLSGRELVYDVGVTPPLPMAV